MLVRTPGVNAEQNSSIRIQDLPEVVMGWSRLGQTKERLIPREANRNVTDADDGPYAFHRISLSNLQAVSSISQLKRKPRAVNLDHGLESRRRECLYFSVLNRNAGY